MMVMMRMMMMVMIMMIMMTMMMMMLMMMMMMMIMMIMMDDDGDDDDETGSNDDYDDDDDDHDDGDDETGNNVDDDDGDKNAAVKLVTIMKTKVILSQVLDEFSPNPVSYTPARMYQGVEVTCQSISGNTELAYNWNKGSVRSFIRPNLNPQYFLSKNGRLYISEVRAEDQ
ncbi:hypothetical protein ElyMa_006193700 [Elysia marginata]|uniref:Ig-like domain-containing protein n=1 Tax=Elysia marginata TaxID=1093978 RepID=A0AAV4H3W2_9GAST|nr:hypothetical protein ElyMa_006193700 [Elysia marginata]